MMIDCEYGNGTFSSVFSLLSFKTLTEQLMNLRLADGVVVCIIVNNTTRCMLYDDYCECLTNSSRGAGAMRQYAHVYLYLRQCSVQYILLIWMYKH